MNGNSVFVNQVGYLPQAKKFAFTDAPAGGKAFFIKDNNQQVMFEGVCSQPVTDSVAERAVCLIDFSDFQGEGDFYIEAEGIKSYTFKISPSVYDDLYFSVLNYFSLSRCGQVVENKAPGGSIAWNHKACHTGLADIYGSSKKKEVDGGWHDAGDYGRYIVAGAKTVMDLLFALKNGKDFPAFDILDEVRFELEWMLKMQREDGAVYHKVSTYVFGGFVSPETETAPLVIAPISTTATADFAGCLAYAARFFKEKDGAFAEKLVSAAEKAQKFIIDNLDLLYQNPPEIRTGGYGDREVRDEKYFALCSLFASTGNPGYLEKAALLWEDMQDNPGITWDGKPKPKHYVESFSWGSVAGYGTEILLETLGILKPVKKICMNPMAVKVISDKRFSKFIDKLKTALIYRAEDYLKITKAASFKTGFDHIVWGSNGYICDVAHNLLLGFYLTGNYSYYDAAVHQLNYVLGCNPLNLCYVTGMGTAYPVNPHHRPSGAVKELMPGMLAGGPAAGLNDEVARKMLSGKPPLECYIDHQQSYSTNEVAIYWNSPLVSLLASVM